MKKIMGILNITPDSFYDGGKYFDLEKAKLGIELMIEQGIDIIDIGGFSSRPGSIIPSVEEELQRILPILDLVNSYDIKFSVDTCRSEVVKEIIKYKNLVYINDISGLKDEKILDIISSTKVGYILMHTKGTPENMQDNPKYNNIVEDIYNFFIEKLKLIRDKKIKNIIIDPGFGFGKTIEDNYIILKNLDTFTKLGYPILAGISRKSMIYKFLGNTPNDVLSETVALNLQSLQNGASILRVHDVIENKNILKIFELMNSLSSEEENFNQWNILKKKIDSSFRKNFYVNEREVWYVNIGKNIGYESYGKGIEFKRPILVLKRIGSMFLCISMTTKGKNDKFHYEIDKNTFGKKSYISLSQIKTIDHKRFIKRIGILSEKDFYKITKKVKDNL